MWTSERASDQGKGSKREREGALWIVSGLRHSVNRRCFCMRCQWTGLLQGIARSFASHIYCPACLPAPAFSSPSSWVGKKEKKTSKGMKKICKPQEMQITSELAWGTEKTRNDIQQENIFCSFLIFLFLHPSLKARLTAWMDINPTSQRFHQEMDRNACKQICFKLMLWGARPIIRKLFRGLFFPSLFLAVSSSLWSLQQRTAEELKRQSPCTHTGELALPIISLKATWIPSLSGSCTWRKLRHCTLAKDLVSTEKGKKAVVGGVVPQWASFQIWT